MRSAMLARLAVLLLTLGIPLQAAAFSVGDHRALTEAAIDAALASGELPLLAAHRSEVVHGATAEDLNLHVKWTGWHHFYSPEGSLDTVLREGSEARVRELWAEALEAARGGDMARAFDRAGHLAHHLQDMASPLHVVPVNHGPLDRFEQFGVGASLERAPPRALAPLSGAEAQRALARETLAAVRSQALPVEGGAIPWSAFWAEPEVRAPGAFGDYGAEIGNAFGSQRVRWRGREHSVPPAGYAAFMDARVSGAVAYTRAFLEWASERLAEEAASDRPAAPRSFRPAPELSLQLVGGLAHDSRGSAPLLGLRAAIPLPRSLRLSVDWTRGVGEGESEMQPGGWSLAVLSPPLWTARPDPGLGLDLRASLGVGLRSWEGQRRVGLPLGLRAQASLGTTLTASAEVLYQGVKPPGEAWAHGVSFTLGLGLAWGDR